MDQNLAWDCIDFTDIPDLVRLNDYVDHFAETTPDAPAIGDLNGISLSYSQLQARIKSLQIQLEGHGVKAGDKVGCWSAPHTMSWICFLATIRAGGIWLGLNPKYTTSELNYILANAQPAAIVAWKTIADIPFDAAFGWGEEEIHREISRIWVEDLSREAVNVPDRSDPSNPCLLVYTSGTTGKPKGALLRQSGLVECSRVQAHHYGQKNARTLNPLPINHVGSICDSGTTVLVTGGLQIFMTEFDPAGCVRAVETEQLTTLGGVPTMLQMMMATPEWQTSDLGSLGRFLWSGSPMPRPSAEALAAYGLPMHNFYGMTETTGSLTFTAPDAGLDELLDTVGYPHGSYEVRLANPETNISVDIGQVGEIQAKSPGVLHSYLDDPEATAAAFTSDGYFKTGDLAELDEKGRIKLRGRAKEMFKSGGYNVYPAEVEAALLAVDSVAHAVVVTKSDPTFYEVGYAFILPEQGHDVDPNTLKKKLSERLANYKIPKFFETVQDFPMLPIGKIDRNVLKERANQASLAQAL